MLKAVRVEESIDFLLESADFNADCCRQKICEFVYLSAMIFLAAYTSLEFNSLKSCHDMQQSQRHVAPRP